jgi:hypothetical protein
MANYYNYVSFTVPLAPEQQDWAIKELTRDPTDDDEMHPGVVCVKSGAPAHLLDGSGLIYAPALSSEFLWIHTDEWTGVDALCDRLRNIMRRFDIPGKWGFNWSQGCSSPRVDAYGGGACVVSQTRIESINTGDWLIEHGVADE